MYEIDPKVFNQDGSINTEAACAIGRKARARAAAGGTSVAAGAISGTIGATRRMLSDLVLSTTGQAAK